MDSPEPDTNHTIDDPTSSVQHDHVASVTATSDGLPSTGDRGEVETLIKRVATLKMSTPVPKAMNEASEMASAIAANVASSPRGALSPDVRRAFADLLTANSEMLHRSARRGA